MVEARVPDLKAAVDIEWNFKKILSNSELQVVAASDLFLPPREMTPFERREILDKNGIQAILVVALKGTRKDTIYHPPTGSETKRKRNKDGSYTTTTYTYGDYTEYKMTQDQELVLLTLQEQPLWVGSGFTSGDFQHNDEKDFAISLAKKAQKELAKDGLIKLPPPPPKKSEQKPTNK